MQPDDPRIRDFLAAALRGDDVSWPTDWEHDAACDDVAASAVFHGVAGLLVERAPAIQLWPVRLSDRLHEHARAQAMWELRHRQLLAALLDQFQDRAIPCLIMKGTAIAYDLYANPSTRSRGDTDLLVARTDVARAKAVLADLGYSGGVLGGVTPEFSLQQVWRLSLPDGATHVIDLHWQVMNAPSLKRLLPFSECFPEARPLPRLSPAARTMDRVRLLVHTAVHRAMQCNAPYVVDGTKYFDPGRLIWSWDLHLIANALAVEDWSRLCAAAKRMGVARPCLQGLDDARSVFGTEFPEEVRNTLENASRTDRTSAYFIRSSALARAWQDVGSIAGLPTKMRYMVSRLVTTEPFLRGKYPGLAGRPLPLLYGRRFLDLLWRRSNAN